MSTISAVIRELESRRDNLETAINTLRGVEGVSRRGPGRPTGSRSISPAGLARIRAAQKKRWAAYHSAQRKGA